jgi:hypothetical protein
MAGQCPRGQPEATRGSLHLGTTGGTHILGPPQARIACQVKRPGELSDQRRQRGDSLSEIQPRISSQRKQPPNLFGGGWRGCWGKHFAHGGNGYGHRRWPERPGDGGGDPVTSEDEERIVAEAGLGRFDRPRSWPVGLDPAGVAGLGQWANGPKPIC